MQFLFCKLRLLCRACSCWVVVFCTKLLITFVKLNSNSFDCWSAVEYQIPGMTIHALYVWKPFTSYCRGNLKVLSMWQVIISTTTKQQELFIHKIMYFVLNRKICVLQEKKCIERGNFQIQCLDCSCICVINQLFQYCINGRECQHGHP